MNNDCSNPVTGIWFMPRSHEKSFEYYVTVPPYLIEEEAILERARQDRLRDITNDVMDMLKDEEWVLVRLTRRDNPAIPSKPQQNYMAMARDEFPVTAYRLERRMVSDVGYGGIEDPGLAHERLNREIDRLRNFLAGKQYKENDKLYHLRNKLSDAESRLRSAEAQLWVAKVLLAQADKEPSTQNLLKMLFQRIINNKLIKWISKNFDKEQIIKEFQDE